MVDIDKIIFEYPYLFLVLIPFIICEFKCKPRVQSFIFPNINIFKKLNTKSNYLLKTLKWITIIFAITALASPIIEDKIEKSQEFGYDIVMILDTSGSMKEEGFNLLNPKDNKFDIVKNLGSDFIEKRESDNIALVIFGEFSFISAPLSFDKDILKDILDRIEIGMAGEKTALYDALALSTKTLKDSNAENKIAILITDGVNTAGSIPEDIAIKMVKDLGIKVYTIGIGGFGEFDARSLQKIAKNSGGKFYHAQNAEILKRVYEEIDELEKSEIKGEIYKKITYLFKYPLFVAFLSMLLYLFFQNRRGI